ncbi:MAG: hypothetical protein HFE43_01980 [Oscillospiraceae bacterium]|jgi:hypothetical protein|nr:hypothetical protein [Oscillospiraceae bacterium]
MKRIIGWIWLGMTVLLAVYSAVSWYLLRGAGAYRLGTRLGGFLAVSWQITALAALAFLIPGLLRLVWVIRRKGAPAAPKKEKAARKPRSGKKDPPLPPTEKLSPASPQDETVLLDEEKLPPAPPQDETVLLGEEKLPPAPPQDKTVLLDEEKLPPASPQDEAIPAEEASAAEKPPGCPSCGAEGKAGQKFCTKCGKPMGGGER